jgi:hypothetical protein
MTDLLSGERHLEAGGLARGLVVGVGLAPVMRAGKVGLQVAALLQVRVWLNYVEKLRGERGEVPQFAV